MKKIRIILQKHRFYVDLIAFILLGQIILYNALPTALQVANHTVNEAPESLRIPYSAPLNKFYLQGGFRGFSSKELYQSYTKMEYYGDNHILMPIYRAVKTGEHLTNLGYNEGFAKKDHDPDNHMKYKSLFSSTWNNMGQLVYAFIPENLKHITTDEQELEVANYILKVRYILAYIHLLGIILFFIALYKRLGRNYAYAYAVVFMLNPGIFFTAGNLFNTILYPMYLLAFVVYFAPNLIKNYTHKQMVYFTLGFSLISVFFNYFGSLYYLIYTWAPAIATIFFIELFYLYQNWNQNTNKIVCTRNSVLRVSVIALTSLIPFVIIYITEIKEMVLLYGEEAKEIMKSRAIGNFMSTKYFKDGSQEINSFGGFLIHLIHYYRNILIRQFATIPALWIELFMPKLLLFIPPILLKMRIRYVVIVFLVFLIYSAYKLKMKVTPVIVYTILAGACFIIWTLGLNLVSTVAAHHLHISGYVYSTYIDIIIAMLVVKTLSYYPKVDDKEESTDIS